MVVSAGDIDFVTHRATLTNDQLERLFQILDLTEDEILAAKNKTTAVDFKLKATSVLKFWKAKEEVKATRRAIINALNDCEYSVAVGKVKTKWGIS